jgi:hypothetical protein
MIECWFAVPFCSWWWKDVGVVEPNEKPTAAMLEHSRNFEDVVPRLADF